MTEAHPGRVGRRLAAIVAADVAGYSRLMHHDEEGTHVKPATLLSDAISQQSTSTAVAQHGRLVLGKVSKRGRLHPWLVIGKFETEHKTHGFREMTPDGFRRLTLKMPNAVESAHMMHPDFRVGDRIFATLGYPDQDWAMVKLKPEQQEMLVASDPEVFSPAKGAWGKRGSTLVALRHVDAKTARSAIRMAWENLFS